MTQDVHSKINVKSSIDNVKQSFASQILRSAAAHDVQTSSNPIEIPTKTGNEYINLFQVKRWALPVKSKFILNEQQISFLFKIFKHKKQSGQKSRHE